MAAFVVSGGLSGYTIAPILNYQDISGNWVPLPSGAVVSSSGFQFTHADITIPGTYTISIRDANAPTIVGTSTSFTVSVPTFQINRIVGQLSDAPFTISGSYNIYINAPTLQYQDDGGAAIGGGTSLFTTTWDPNDNDKWTLSTDRLTATYNGPDYTDPVHPIIDDHVRAVTPILDGQKVYFEIFCAQSGMSFQAGLWNGITTKAWSYRSTARDRCLLSSYAGVIDSGTGISNPHYSINIAPSFHGDGWLGFAVDRVNHKFWWHGDDPGGLWAFDNPGQTFGWDGYPVGQHDPASNLGGYDISALAGTPVYVTTLGSLIIGPVQTINGGAKSFSKLAPIGFTPLDGQPSSWLSLPAGSNVAKDFFSFTHPGVHITGTHFVTVRDANATIHNADSNAFTVVALSDLQINVDTPVGVLGFSPFTLTGSLVNYPYVPQLEYEEGAVFVVTGAAVDVLDLTAAVWRPLPVGATITQTGFSFPHAALSNALGSYAIAVRDATYPNDIGGAALINVIGQSSDGAPG